MAEIYSLHILRDALTQIDELIDTLERLDFTRRTEGWLERLLYMQDDVRNQLRHAELIALQDTRAAQLLHDAEPRRSLAEDVASIADEQSKQSTQKA